MFLDVVGEDEILVIVVEAPEAGCYVERQGESQREDDVLDSPDDGSFSG